MRAAVFLDRDGTLVHDRHYLSDPAALELLPGAAAAVRRLNQAGLFVALVTNQSGIGRGIYTTADMDRVHDVIQSQLGGLIDGFYHCPHLPCDDCECRKPGLKMIRDAERDLDLELSRSWFIGDKKIDVEAGKAAGMGTALVLTGYGEAQRHSLVSPPDIIAADLRGAAEEILSSSAAEIVV